MYIYITYLYLKEILYRHLFLKTEETYARKNLGCRKLEEYTCTVHGRLHNLQAQCKMKMGSPLIKN